MDLKSAGGRERLGAFLETADLLVTSQRPAALARLGLSASRLARTCRQLRVLQIVGDLRAPGHAGHDLTYQAQAGLVGAECRGRCWPTSSAPTAPSSLPCFSCGVRHRRSVASACGTRSTARGPCGAD
ncbi:MAG: CoA transferase [Vicinamibacterales bacterium]